MTRPSSPAASSRRGSAARARASRRWTARPMRSTPRDVRHRRRLRRHRPGRRDGRRVHRLFGRRPPTSSSRAPGSIPIRTAQTGRDTGITSDAQYRFARGVDPGFVVPGLELATRLILELCGGEPSEVPVAGADRPRRPRRSPSIPAYVAAAVRPGHRAATRIVGDPDRARLRRSTARRALTVQPPTWRRDVDGKADLVEEVARIAGFDALPADAPAGDGRAAPAAC